jgi:hypothetical protein
MTTNTKDNFSDGTSTYAMYRLMYAYKTYTTNVKTWGAKDSSDTTQRKRTIAVGKAMETPGYICLSHTKGNSVRDAVRRVRGGGSNVHKKYGLK